MASSKKDFSIISKNILDFINNLTEEQFNNIVNGTADIKYVEKGLDNDKREIFNSIVNYLINENDDEKRINYVKENSNLATKAKLIEFCKYLKIDYKQKDTIDVIISNIIDYIKINKDVLIYKFSKSENLELGIEEVAKKLENSMDVDEAKAIITGSKVVESKTNLLKLAKKLNVFVDREFSYENIMDNIIKSVVESKIRSYTIRKKL
ncbi:hypothetical protein G6Z26_15060 [Clostridium perfringens]|uniref:hypothetical protein n=2 Tax=Clostridium perfringens TaxID=1502 RepID=UPI0013E3DF39|nr:hypothetical protein [Clostridium perfringens]MCG4545997.1 hypothetical protein [Clostridium perfringens]MCG4553809.1 hypothetical protein [Clostridium perfringens]MCG4557278.1 hypothetical protein [Clostridium perfringens]MCG4560486.1 hypothetical protein [Clostridium perfringens]MDK0615755.1 hypothetical protein [Clostridium perfringens]